MILIFPKRFLKAACLNLTEALSIVKTCIFFFLDAIKIKQVNKTEIFIQGTFILYLTKFYVNSSRIQIQLTYVFIQNLFIKYSVSFQALC